MRKFFLLLSLFLAACAAQATPTALPSATPLPFATATLPPTLTPRPSATPAPPTITPTLEPIFATLTAQINVRSAPAQSATSLGLLNFGAQVRVVGKNSTGDWWQIVYPENSATTGWVTVAYAPLPEAETAKIPVITDPQANQPAAPAANETPLSAARTASLKAQIFVRLGPGQAYESLGQLNAGTVVTLTGRNQTNVWVQIEYPGGPEGKAWVAGAYLVDANLSGLPYYDNQGQLVFAPTAALNPGQPTPSPTAFSAAALDGDSEQNPAIRQVFSPSEARELTFSSDLSAPNGDLTDWVAFTPYEPTNQATYVYLKLECSGNGGITAILEKDGLPVPETRPLVCGNYDFALRVLGGQEYQLVLNADGSGGTLRYTRYTLTIKSEP